MLLFTIGGSCLQYLKAAVTLQLPKNNRTVRLKKVVRAVSKSRFYVLAPSIYTGETFYMYKSKSNCDYISLLRKMSNLKVLQITITLHVKSNFHDVFFYRFIMQE